MDTKSDNKLGFISAEEFEKIKKEHDYRCVTCGSKENEYHFLRHNVMVELRQGRIDVKKGFVIGNVIPQCQICNKWS
ncbi:hypothetical protein BKH42_05155 [Helicobacter sp. 13S00482-2]|uniref:hypothetical protein n=1 Tax=Helicobacter sp. 13S00482-2 TaxID=1476200 RepID=UPI000BA71A49|nr:hypothetical protein [Helicobacter sp. 13S00482-2]PAF53571.1 hypothetical protein BKH42_05155 [Helicobacter sp. 13S00482-2]